MNKVRFKIFNGLASDYDSLGQKVDEFCQKCNVIKIETHIVQGHLTGQYSSKDSRIVITIQYESK